MSSKLYVLVRADLSRSQQAVQAGHAVVEWIKAEACKFDWDGREIKTRPWRWGWEGQTLIYLKAENLKDLTFCYEECEDAVPFHEPDIGGEMTAFAVFDPPSWFESLRLL